MRLDEGHAAAVSLDPVVPLVFLVREDGRGRLLLESCGDGQSAGTGADDDDVEDFWRHVIIVCILVCCCHV